MTIREQIDALMQPSSERLCGACGHASVHNWRTRTAENTCQYAGLRCGCTEERRVIADLLADKQSASVTTMQLVENATKQRERIAELEAQNAELRRERDEARNEIRAEHADAFVGYERHHAARCEWCGGDPL